MKIKTDKIAVPTDLQNTTVENVGSKWQKINAYVDKATTYLESIQKEIENITNQNQIRANTALTNDAIIMQNNIKAALYKLSTVQTTVKDLHTPSSAADEASGHPSAPLKNQLKNAEQAINDVLDTAKSSNIVKYVPHQNIFQRALSGLADICSSIKNSIANIGKTDTQRFQEFKEQYKSRTKEPDSPTIVNSNSNTDPHESTHKGPR